MYFMKIYLDDLRECPNGFTLCRSVNEAIKMIINCENNNIPIELVSLDHDLGDYSYDGGDGIKLLDFLCERQTFYPISLHTMNPVGRANMLRTINRFWNNK